LIQIKKVALSDLETLRDISRQTFFETFASENTAEDMQAYLDKNLNLPQLTIELTNSNSEFYFAILNNDIIGYLKINRGDAQTELKNSQALEIERIYVSKQFQGKDIGKTLYNTALQRAIEIHAPYIWLGVWEKNLKAIHFYKKNGFVEFDKHVFKLGADEQTDILMKVDLVNLKR
jgi:ribosomal protein S18 acetylase RimI-like enzyme